MPESSLSPSEESFLASLTRTLSLAPESDVPLRFSDTLAERLAAVREILRILPAAPAEPSLLFFDPATKTARAVPIGECLLVGRTVSTGLNLAAPSLSGTHFSISRERDDFILRDPASSPGKPSTSGTFVNLANARISSPVVLRGCDQIQAGGIRFVFTEGYVPAGDDDPE